LCGSCHGLGKLRLVVGVLGSVVEVVVVGWLLLLLGGLCYFVLEDMLCAEDMLSVEMARAVDDWLWHSGRLIICRRLAWAILVSLWWKERRI
jgi:hypothetical protein